MLIDLSPHSIIQYLFVGAILCLPEVYLVGADCFAGTGQCLLYEMLSCDISNQIPSGSLKRDRASVSGATLSLDEKGIQTLICNCCQNVIRVGSEEEEIRNIKARTEEEENVKAQTLSVVIVIVHFAPKFLDVLTYFWPLLVSTTLFLIAVVVFGRSSQQSLGSPGEKAGEEIIDYVASQPESDQGHKDE
ncbi:hypothetical protein Tco_0674717 [Tanacetum coccineum]